MLISFAVIIGLILIWIIASILFVRNVERLSYTVLEQKNGYEIRKYDPYIIAETTADAKYKEGMNQGFRVVADYIFGNNESKESIAMTTPVLDQPSSEKIAMTTPVFDQEKEDQRSIAFVMPAQYSLESLPTPVNKNVTIREVPGGTFAVLPFRGWRWQSRVKSKQNQLKKRLEADNILFKDEVIMAYYHPPLTFPLVSLSEVLVEIQPE